MKARLRLARVVGAALVPVGLLPVVLVGAAAAAAGADPAAAATRPEQRRQTETPDGLVSGQLHHARIRPLLGEIEPSTKPATGRAAKAGRRAVATCDPAQVAALARVPTTSRGDDRTSMCAVLAWVDAPKRRSLVGAAWLRGSELGQTHPWKDAAGAPGLLLRPTARGKELIAAGPPGGPLVLDVDGEIVGEVTLDAMSQLRVALPGRDRDEARAVADVVDDSRGELLIDLTRQATMRRHARELMHDASARVDEKARFLHDCPDPEDAAALVLGCYDGRIFVLRVTDPDLVGVMTVTAAHEMLHAAFEDMPADERRDVVRRLEAHLERSGDPKIEELLTLYEDLEPGAQGNELHSLVGTQVRDLPRALERHYAQYFYDRDELVDAFEGYQAIFDFLQANAERLSGELDAMRTQLDALQAEGDAAGAEADRLYAEIQRLRGQGRINESNGLVGAQNAAADRANSLGAEYNALVDQYNAKVTELNELALYTSRKYNEISPVPIDPPT